MLAVEVLALIQEFLLLQMVVLVAAAMAQLAQETLELLTQAAVEELEIQLVALVDQV
jgi:hypothetical protein